MRDCILFDLRAAINYVKIYFVVAVGMCILYTLPAASSFDSLVHPRVDNHFFFIIMSSNEEPIAA